MKSFVIQNWGRGGVYGVGCVLLNVERPGFNKKSQFSVVVDVGGVPFVLREEAELECTLPRLDSCRCYRHLLCVIVAVLPSQSQGFSAWPRCEIFTPLPPQT